MLVCLWRGQGRESVAFCAELVMLAITLPHPTTEPRYHPLQVGVQFGERLPLLPQPCCRCCSFSNLMATSPSLSSLPPRLFPRRQAR